MRMVRICVWADILECEVLVGLRKEALLPVKLVEVMGFQQSYLKS